MRLVRCEGCGRHVRVEETQCPFCRAAHAGTRSPDGAFLRVSRAAVFAGAAVVGGCWTGSQPTQPTTNNGQFAEPPPDTQVKSEPTPKTNGTISGRLVDNSAQQGMPGVTLAIYHAGDYERGGPPVITTMSDADGTYTLPGLPAGNYTVVVQYGPRPRWIGVNTSVRVGESALVNVILSPVSAPVPHPIPAPYGAPPARRRVV